MNPHDFPVYASVLPPVGDLISRKSRSYRAACARWAITPQERSMAAGGRLQPAQSRLCKPRSESRSRGSMTRPPWRR